MKKIIILFVFLALNFIFLLQKTEANTQFNAGLKKTGSNIGYDTKTKADTVLSNKIGLVIKTLLSIMGTIFLAFMIYGGVIWMNAQGNESEITKAQGIIKNTIIGIIIVLAAYAITDIVKQIFFAVTENS
jgi:TRAP-type C4-dicarboxylate transport system permease small subunit